MRQNGVMGPLDIFNAINEKFDDAIIVTDVGQHQMLTSQYVDITENRQIIMSGGLGTMGYGLPGAIGAKIGNPDKPVIAISGDGGMQMNIQELATAVLEELPVILCIFNNEYLGMVRQWQTLFYGKRYSNTVLQDQADFVKVAEALGVKGIRVTKKEEMGPAIREAIEGGKPALIDVWIDCDEKVFPMVPAGAPIEDVFDAEDLAKKEQEKD